jgi:hypothetical protein
VFAVKYKENVQGVEIVKITVFNGTPRKKGGRKSQLITSPEHIKPNTLI